MRPLRRTGGRGRQNGRALDTGGELFDEPGLADARVAEDRHEGGAAVAHGAVVRVVQQLELLLAAHEPGARPTQPALEDTNRPPRPHLLAGADLDRADVLDLDRLDRQAARAGAERDRSRGGGLL